MDPRPLSPHLQIYRWQLTAVLSILHRLSGIALLGVVLEFIAGLYCLSQGVNLHTQYLILLSSWPLQTLNIICLFFLTYHFFNGIRHLFWDIGWGLGLTWVYRTGHTVLVMTFIVSSIILGLWYLT